MKFRFALALISLFLSLNTSTDRKSSACPGCWLGPAYVRPFDRMFGVNIHFTAPRPGEVKMISDAGFRWVRTDFKWEATEQKRGRYDFSSYDRLLNELDLFQIHALFILDYGNRLYTDRAPSTEVSRRAFAKWAVAAARHFANRGVTWEIYNEPNHPQFWPTPNANEYSALALAVGHAFRDAGLHEKLIGPASSRIDFSFLEACFRQGVLDFWSAVSVHPYRESSPEYVAGEYSRLRQLIARYPGGRERGQTNEPEIISGEWGYSSAGGIDEEAQAALLARQFLTNAANGVALSIWYDWRDDGIDANDPEHHFGLVRHQLQSGNDQPYQPKPAYLAARTLIERMAGYHFEQRLEVGSDEDYVLMFSNGNERRFAAWTTSLSPHRVTIPAMTGAFSITKLTGDNGGTIQASESLSVQISAAPIYLARLP